MGVAAVVVLFLAVRRSFGTAAAAIAGTVMALTPAAVLIFRYDNPDALLTLLLVSAAWALLRALDAGRMRWLALAGTLVGLGFMTKFLQAWLVLPVFALVWIVAAPGGWRRRLAGLVVSAAAVAVASLAWPVAVDLIPAASRPYIGGSTGNSVFDLILGYDGLGRIFGGVGNGGGDGGGGGGGMFGGSAGILRLFNEQFGGQVSWLIPYAVIAGASGLVLRLRAGRTDRRLVGYLLWGGWLAVHVLVFSFMSGVIHPYYSVILAPAIGALVGGGHGRAVAPPVAIADRRARSSRALRRQRGLGVGAPGADAGLRAGPGDRGRRDHRGGRPSWWPSPAGRLLAGERAGRRAVAVALAALLAGPAVFAAQTMATAHSGGDPAAGPARVGFGGGPGGQAPTDGAVAGVPGGTAGARRPAEAPLRAAADRRQREPRRRRRHGRRGR